MHAGFSGWLRRRLSYATVAATLALAAGILPGCGTTTPQVDTSDGTPAGSGGPVKASFHLDGHKAADRAVFKHLHPRGVVCEYRGGHVWLTGQMHSTYPLPVTVTITPRYVLDDGTANSGLAFAEFKFKMGQTSGIDYDAGAPDGGGQAISRCEPTVLVLRIGE